MVYLEEPLDEAKCLRITFEPPLMGLGQRTIYLRRAVELVAFVELVVMDILIRLPIAFGRLQRIYPPDPLHLLHDPFLLSIPETNTHQGGPHGFEQMPPSKRRSCSTMFFRGFLVANVWIFNAISVARPAKGLRTKSEGNVGTDIVNHFLSDHAGVDGTPVPLVFVGHVEPGDAVENDGLDLGASGAILIPDALYPQVDVDVIPVIVDKGRLGNITEWIVEAVSWGQLPLLGKRLGPSGDKQINGDGVFKEIVDLSLRVLVPRENER